MVLAMCPDGRIIPPARSACSCSAFTSPVSVSRAAVSWARYNRWPGLPRSPFVLKREPMRRLAQGPWLVIPKRRCSDRRRAGRCRMVTRSSCDPTRSKGPQAAAQRDPGTAREPRGSLMKGAF